MSSINHDLLFATCVTYVDNKELITDEVIATSKKILSKTNNKPFGCPCISTFKEVYNILNFEVFAEIKAQIVSSIILYCQQNNINNNNLGISDSWLNLYQQNGYQDLHLHQESLLSGVFFIKSEEKHDLLFQAPWAFFQPMILNANKEGSKNNDCIKYPSVEGRCYIFPSHLMHRTLPATSERISLSFNVSKFGGGICV